jgi:hypothetical protein
VIRRLAAVLAAVPPERAALFAVMGLVIGVFPMVWCPTLMCLAVAFKLRLNPAPLLAINQITTPLQFALMLPFARAGAWVFRSAPPAANPAQAAGGMLLNAIVGWTVLALPVGVAVYVGLAARNSASSCFNSMETSR